MRPATSETIAVAWLLACLVGSLHGDPQQPHWVPFTLEEAPRYYPSQPIASSDSFRQGYRDHRPYQLERQFPERRYDDAARYSNGNQRIGYQDVPGLQDHLRGVYNDRNRRVPTNDYKVPEELYYQSLLGGGIDPSRMQDSYPAENHEDRESYRDYLPLDDPSEEIESSQNSYVTSYLMNEDVGAKNNSEDEDIVKKMDLLTEMLTEKSYAPTPEDLEALNSLEDQMIARSVIPEEAKRVARQVRQQRPGFFWTLARVAYETFNDTKSAIQQIQEIVNNNFLPETTTRISAVSSSLTNAVTTPPSTTVAGNRTANNVNATTTTTTTPRSMLTRTEFQGIVRRNLRGLVRLFNIEWADALNQSKVTIGEFQRDLGNQIRPYLQDNPNVKL